MLTQARGADSYSIWFTNKVRHVANFFSKDAKKDRNYRVEYRDRKALPITVAPPT
jgi:hypothetical protein